MPKSNTQRHGESNKIAYTRDLFIAKPLIAEPQFSYQPSLPFQEIKKKHAGGKTLNIELSLRRLLNDDLSFKGQRTSYATHNLHSFPAKFPPQLPHRFIKELTLPWDIILDPMAGSGTTLVEAALLERFAIGVDIDPLAVLISYVKSSSYDLLRCAQIGNEIIKKAKRILHSFDKSKLIGTYPEHVVEFFNYWFTENTIAEFYALISAVRFIEDANIRALFEVVFSSIIITKTGHLTLARDLAHSRPHRDLNKQITKNALEAFSEKLNMAIDSLTSLTDITTNPMIICADSRALPLADNSVQLVFTSPPYAANAIDYMRVHKFSLTWLGYDLHDLTTLRKRYVGAEIQHTDFSFPSETASKALRKLNRIDNRRAKILAFYFYDTQIFLQEMLRVLAPGHAAVIIVGSSTIREITINVPGILSELAHAVGFQVAGIATREIIRNSRMMPTSHNSSRNGIEARMHEEGVVGLIKPAKGKLHALS